jgi:hypothetical protein
MIIKESKNLRYRNKDYRKYQSNSEYYILEDIKIEDITIMSFQLIERVKEKKKFTSRFQNLEKNKEILC